MLTNNPKIVTTNLAACWDPKQASTVPSVSVIADKIADLSSKAYTTYTSGGITYYVWTYTSSGSFNTGDYPLDLDVLLVAGGGGGGAYASGAGGAAGGVRALSRQTVAAGIHTITVGAGGAGGVWTTPLAQKGNDTIWNSTSNYAFSAPAFLTTGGGEGGRGWSSLAGGAGGSGGGGGSAGSCGSYPGCGGAGGSGSGGSYDPVEGYAGGAGLCPQYNDGAGGGGGGAAAAGTNAVTSGASAIAGSGGAGLANDWRTGSTQYYGGGGGGGCYQGADGTGGTGGGGNGGDVSTKTPGTANTGGGGGGSDDYIGTGTPPANSGAPGGSGIVVIRLADVPGSINRSFLSDQAMNGGTAQMYTGAAVDFDGTDAYVTYGDVTWLDGLTTISVCCWLYQDGVPPETSGIFLSKNDALECWTKEGGTERYVMSINNDHQIFSGAPTPTKGEWVQIVMTWNSTGDVRKLYLNGELVDTNTSGNQGGNSINNTGDALSIGARPSGYEIDGKMSDVKIFAKELSAANVKELYDDSKVIIPTKNDASGGFLSQTDLALWAPLTEGAGSIAYDGSGYGRDGTYTGTSFLTGQTGCPQLVTGYNRPMLFNGSTNYVSVGNPAVSQFTWASNFSLSAWIWRSSSSGGFDHIIGKTYGNYRLALNGQQLSWRLNSNGLIAASGSSDIPSNTWTHVAATWATNSSDGGTAKIYINGSLNATQTGTANWTSGSADFQIGNSSGESYYFNGLINECIAYNKTLTLGEVQALAATGLNGGPFPPDPMSLIDSSNVVGYWRNDGNPSLASTATWTDHSGNGNNGTAYGSPYDLLFKQGYNGSESTNSGRDNQGFPLKQKDVGAIGMHLHGVPNAGSATDPGNTANPLMAPPGQTVISSGEVNAGNAFAVSAWINITSLGTGYVRPIARKQTQNGNWPAYGLSVTSTGQLRGEYSTTNYGQCLETYTTAAGLIEQDKWYYVVFLKPTGAPSVNYLDVKLYINGVDTAWTNSLYGNHLYSNTVATSTQPTYMGRFIDGNDLTGNWVNVFVGQMGPVSIYSRGLTPEEVTQNFNAQRSRFGI